MEQCWYIIFKILFPNAPRPQSPCKPPSSSLVFYRSLTSGDADDKSSVVVQLETQSAPQRLSRLFRERLSQLECTPVTGQLRVDEVQTLLSQVVEDSMAELLQQKLTSNPPSSGPSSTASADHSSNPMQDSHSSQDYRMRTALEVQGNQQRTSRLASPNESLPSLLDADLGTIEFDSSTFDDFTALANSQLDISHIRPAPFDWCGFSQAQSAEEDVSPLSQSDAEQAGPPLTAEFTPKAAFEGRQAIQTDDEDQDSRSMHHTPGSIPASELPFSESSLRFTLPQAPSSRCPPPATTMEPNDEPTVVAQPLQTKRSQRSLDSGYGSISTMQQGNALANNSNESLTYPSAGFHETLAESWEPAGADEEAFCEQAKISSRFSYFSESRAVDYPSVTY
jgi:hypothetical protein